MKSYLEFEIIDVSIELPFHPLNQNNVKLRIIVILHLILLCVKTINVIYLSS